MNPFTTPDKIYISQHPQDMRAGIQTLAALVVADFGRDPVDGALYCFVSVRVNFFGNSSLLRPIFVELVRQIKRELTVFSCK